MRIQKLAFVALAVSLLVPTVGCEKPVPTPSLPDSSFPFDFGGVDLGVPDMFAYPDATVDTCTEAGATLGDACTGAETCDDGCYCNGVERCEGSVCVAGNDPCTDTVDCTLAACLEETNTCFEMPQHELCSDGDACNGMEICDPDPLVGGCRPSAPLYCNDESACTVDSCDTALGCVYNVRDLDGDGFTDGRCGGEDCDDDPRFGTHIYPGAVEDCTNRRDDNCDGLRDYNDPTCSPANDTCGASAVALPGAGTYSGSTRGLRGDYTLACGGGSGPDSVFTFSLTEAHDVRVTAAGAGGGAVAIRSLANCATGPELKCNTSTAPSALIRSLPAGDYAIIVKTNTAGAFDLNLRITDPTTIPPVDQCGPGTVDISAGGTFTGNFDEVEDDYSLACNFGSGAKDAAYRFTITSPKDVTISGGTTGMWTPTTYLSLTTDCNSTAASLSCLADSAPRILRRSLPAGTYYVLIESGDLASTTWTITATITDPVPPPVGDTCLSPVDITAAGGRVPAGALELDGSASCLTWTGGYTDAYFMFDVTTVSDVELTTSTTGWSDTVSLQTSCGSSGTELRCRTTSGTGTQLFRSLAPGRYFVMVATQATFGDISASVRMLPATPIPANDTCPGAIVLTAPSMRVSGTLIGFGDDAISGSCGGGGLADAFYTFTLDVRTQFSAIATRVGGGTQQLVLRSGGCSGSEAACASASPTAAIDAALAPGVYYLEVEQSTWDGPEGDFTLNVFFTPL